MIPGSVQSLISHSDLFSSDAELICIPFMKQMLHHVLTAPFSSQKLIANSFLKSSCQVMIVSPCRENSCKVPMKLRCKITYLGLFYSPDSFWAIALPSIGDSSAASGSSIILTSSGCTRLYSSIISSDTIYIQCSIPSFESKILNRPVPMSIHLFS